MEDTQKEKETGWFSDLNLRSLVMIAAISLFAGGSGGAGIVATKGVQAASGMSEEKADVKYLSKTEAERRIDARDKQYDALRKEMLTREVYDAYHKSDSERMDRIEKMQQQILENQTRFR